MSIYPDTDLVILAGGQARRMQGKNKLLQQFDQEIQLLKIYRKFCDEVSKIWVNSYRDCTVYQKIIPEIQCFSDDQEGFFGPLMGMKSAWSHVQADFILFIPCDITFIPAGVLSKMHQTLSEAENSQAVFISINEQNLYPFCLLKRESLATIEKHLADNQLSIRKCLDDLKPQIVKYENPISFHSINSERELKQYREELQILSGSKPN
ncbi:molybdenum cofactor guanylyltransferase [Acinetobacter calcoaceticus]|uniref:molybdenum cofactor guanylyltransferase n=1 Tax=Acinetobacter calcoaceticus TaxID=471 RepID=UPI0002FA27CA|nr:NTP transferase domain-containing protein [Acinetobacter calcoaceticus]